MEILSMLRTATASTLISFGLAGTSSADGNKPDVHKQVEVIKIENKKPDYKNIAIDALLTAGGFVAGSYGMNKFMNRGREINPGK